MKKGYTATTRYSYDIERDNNFLLARNEDQKILEQYSNFLKGYGYTTEVFESYILIKW